MKRILIFSLLALAAVFAACSNNGVEGKKNLNLPPTVWLAAGPPEGSIGTYRITLFWGGWDPDGEIKRYEYRITNNVGIFNPADTLGMPWQNVLGNDSTFTFSADQESAAHDSLESQNVQFQRSHTFFIRAIDTQGTPSKQPAYRSFTSTTLSPSVKVDVPVKNALNAAEVPPITTFKWHAVDYINDLILKQDPDSVQWALPRVPANSTFEKTLAYMRSPASEKEWHRWVWYKAPQDSGKFWTTPVIDNGNYLFCIRAKDEAGAITPVLDEKDNVRRVHVGPLTSGPLMSVTNDYIGVIRTTSCNTPTTILDSPAGVPLEFKIRATAASYGGTIAGYRYGWDIADLNDPEQWEIDLTPFVGSVATVPGRTFFFGTHTLTMEVVDNSGYCTRVEVKVNIVQFTLERSLLVVDDDNTDENATSGWDNGGVWPNDAEHDAFWADMMSEVQGFDPEIDMVNTHLGFIPLATLAQYKSIVWDVYSDVARQNNMPLIYAYISHRPKNPDNAQAAVSGKVLPNVLALAMAAGSHIMICGNQPIQDVASRVYSKGVKFPLIFLYELDPVGAQNGSGPDVNNPSGDLSFAYRELCLETMDFAVLPASVPRGNKQYCRVDIIRGRHGNVTRDDTMREAVAADPNFPTVGLRPEAAAPGKWYDPAVRGLNAEVYNPAYFRQGGACQYVPINTRSCFQPIYTLGCFDTLEPTYHQPIAFWTSAYADRVADVPGAVGARSLVIGFEPAFIAPDDLRPGMDYILYSEWKLPRRANIQATTSP